MVIAGLVAVTVVFKESGLLDSSLFSNDNC